MLVFAMLIVTGLIVLAFAADHLVIGSGRLAERLGISPVVVGVVVIGLGTSAPELVVAGTAGARGHADLAVASLVGSNIINLTLVLGVAGLTAGLTVRSSILRREAPLSVAAVTVFAIALLYGLGPASGTALIIALIAAVILLVRFARSSPRDVLAAETADYLADTDRPRLAPETIRTILGLGGTILGAQLLVTNAAQFAIAAGVSPEVVGFTLIAVGTSLPELVTSIQAQRRGNSDLLVGNLFGSNLVNSLGGGVAIAFTADAVVLVTHPAIVVAMVGISGIAWVLLARGQQLTRAESVILLVGYAAVLPLIT